MPQSKRPFLPIFLIVFIDLLGFGIILPLLPYIAENFAANAAQIGLLTAAYSFFQFIAAPILGSLSDRYGRKNLLVLSQIGSAAGYIILGLAGSLPLLFLARIIDGITGGNISIAQAYMADITTKKNRAAGMGILGAAFGLGFILGPAIGGILSQFGFAVPAFFAAGVAMLAAIATVFMLPETINLKKVRLSPRTKLTLAEIKRVLRLYPVGLMIISFFLISLAFSGMQATFALWTEHSFGFGPTENGYLFALVGVTSIITQLRLLAPLVKRFGETKILTNGVFLLALGLLMIALATTPLFIYPAIVLIAAGNGLTQPLVQSLASESVSPQEYGSTMGILHSSAGIGRIFGPIIGGQLFYLLGRSSPYYVSSLIILGVFFYLKKRLLPAQERAAS
jgi:DHA1 family tetracycline resistance protein-like MFS transporter